MAKISKGPDHIFLLIILVLIILGGIGYWAYKNSQIRFTPSQKQTPSTPSSTSMSEPTANQVPDANLANWKTYTGSGFSFQYPSNFFVRSVTKDLSGKLVYSTELVFSDFINVKLAENFYIDIGKLTTDKNDVFELIKEYGVGELVKIGINDAIYVGPDTELGDYSYSLVNKGLVYSLGIIPSEQFQGDKFKILKVTIDQILSSFRILD